MEYAIFPPIGIARLGNSASEFFIGPEYFDSPGTELVPGGPEVPVTAYKTGDTGNPATSYQVKRQASRFRLYERNLPADAWQPAALPAGATIQWSVRLVNMKDGIVRPPAGPPTGPLAPKTPITPDNARAGRVIDSQWQSIASDSATAVPLAGTYLNDAVTLGELRTDSSGNLLVLGGAGLSVDYDGGAIGGFYSNQGWYDDTADGPVQAQITIPGHGPAIDAAPAWVVVAPPDFAPDVHGVVTLYDEMLQAALGTNPPTPAKPSFTQDILPMVQRARNLQWVNKNSAWANMPSDSDLADPASPQSVRQTALDIISTTQTALHSFTLCDWQQTYLDEYLVGNFTPGPAVVTPPATLEAQALTRAALDGGVGQGFYPGIEAGVKIKDTSWYAAPFDFRLDPAQVNPGNLTALMALPWQADFYDCGQNWWPSQRPNNVFQTAGGPMVNWAKGINGYQSMVDNVMRLGVVTPVHTPGGTDVQLELQRDPSL